MVCIYPAYIRFLPPGCIMKWVMSIRNGCPGWLSFLLSGAKLLKIFCKCIMRAY